MRSNPTWAVAPLHRVFPTRPLWRADRCPGRLCSGAHETHELRLDGVEEHLVPRARPEKKPSAGSTSIARRARG
jgi:hypothetical protein